jgi:hypothetical protein
MSIEEYYHLTIDKYYKLFDNYLIKSITGERYKTNKDYILIEFTYLERIYFARNKCFSIHLKNEINKLFSYEKEYFFKLSNRSPKDILESGQYEILDEDHRTIRTQKKIKQLEILKIKNTLDIEYLLLNSKRCQEDITDYNEDYTKKLYLVFQEWKPNLGQSIEFRLYINKKKLVGINLFKPDFYSTRTIIPVEILLHYSKQMIELFNTINLDRYILDCYINHDDPLKVYFIELNPFIEDANTFSFEYTDIDSAQYLIVTL